MNSVPSSRRMWSRRVWNPLIEYTRHIPRWPGPPEEVEDGDRAANRPGFRAFSSHQDRFPFWLTHCCRCCKTPSSTTKPLAKQGLASSSPGNEGASHRWTGGQRERQFSHLELRHPKRLELPVKSAVLRITEPPITSRRRYHLPCTQAHQTGQNQEPPPVTLQACLSTASLMPPIQKALVSVLVTKGSPS